MQGLHSIGVGGGGVRGSSGRFFGGGGGDRRLRVHGHTLAQQALKCPRCDSLNTKFCYYNNYNLSQPRHFCKACRRYWTKGGVLRSVPVGGGCRKTKRSKSKSGGAGDVSRELKSKAQSPSSTDSSSLSAVTPSSAEAAAVAEEVSALSAAASDSATKVGFSGAMFYDANPSAKPNFDDHGCQAPLMNHPSSADGQIFTEIGSFDGLMASSDNTSSMIGLSVPDIPTTSYDAPAADNPGPEVDEFKMQDIHSDVLTAELDWEICGGVSGEDQSMFDLTAALDPSYWSQPQWTDSDHSLPYLPYFLL